MWCLLNNMFREILNDIVLLLCKILTLVINMDFKRFIKLIYYLCRQK